jgi:naphthoate synthase
LSYETIRYQEDGPIGTITLNRPDDGNMFTPLMCHEIATASTTSAARRARA